MSVGENIRRLRNEKGLTQKKLGSLCNPTISESTIRKYELGILNPKIETLQKIAKALEVPVSEIDNLDILLDKTISYFDNMTSKKTLINKYYDELNEKGQEKAIEKVELLTKIPEYRHKK